MIGFIARFACTVPESDGLPPSETVARQRLADTPITVSGRLFDDLGAPIAGAAVTIGNSVATSDVTGTFTLDDLPRTNAWLVARASGRRDARVALGLVLSPDVAVLDIGPMWMQPLDAAVPRLVIGGDTQFGRHYLQHDGILPDGQVPEDDPLAPIRASDPEPGSTALLTHVTELFVDADWSALNLECAVTDAPFTPHPDQRFLLFTLPDSLGALVTLGIDYVSSGNNHSFDFLSDGLADTLAHLQAFGLGNSGAGMESTSAWEPHREEAPLGLKISAIAASSVSGSDNPSFLLVATEEQGGAADLRDSDAFVDAIESERLEGRVPIALLHSGREYSPEASDTTRDAISVAAEAGAALIVSTHPHVVQGVERVDGILGFHSLGNFLFDQDRHETLLGIVAQVDLATDGDRHAVAIPIASEDYTPRPLTTGEMSGGLIRRMGEFSEGVTVVPWLGRGWIPRDDGAVERLDRIVTAQVDIGFTGEAVLDLRLFALPGESLAEVSADRPADAQPGRDLLDWGTFEDEDIDGDGDDIYVASHWPAGSASFVCADRPHRGALAMCMTRTLDNVEDAVLNFGHRVRVWGDAIDAPNYDLSVIGWARGDASSPIDLNVTWRPTEGTESYGTTTTRVFPGGTTTWTSFLTHLETPSVAEARALDIGFRMEPPSRGVSVGVIDDVAIVSWEEVLSIGAPTVLAVPNDRDFLLIHTDPGPLEVTLTFRGLRPAVIP